MSLTNLWACDVLAHGDRLCISSLGMSQGQLHAMPSKIDASMQPSKAPSLSLSLYPLHQVWRQRYACVFGYCSFVITRCSRKPFGFDMLLEEETGMHRLVMDINQHLYFIYRCSWATTFFPIMHKVKKKKLTSFDRWYAEKYFDWSYEY